MHKYFYIILVMILFGQANAYASMLDPTRPPEYINSDNHFIMLWQLDAIIISIDRKIAVINDQSLQIGDEINGYQLTAIMPDSVQLQGADGKMTLFLLDRSMQMNPVEEKP